MRRVQKMSFSASCRMRASLADEITPNADEPTAVFGAPKEGLLRALNASARNCNRKDSRMTVFFDIAKSKFTRPGVRTSGNVRERCRTCRGSEARRRWYRSSG